MGRQRLTETVVNIILSLFTSNQKSFKGSNNKIEMNTFGWQYHSPSIAGQKNYNKNESRNFN